MPHDSKVKERARNNFLVLRSDLCQVEMFRLTKTAGLVS